MTATAPAAAPAGRFTPVLLLLFAASGFAALVYEIVWFHLLRLAVGSSAISLAFLLGSFMGGMCLGSLLLPRLLPQRWHPLRVYALLELGIGGLGAAMPWLLPLLGRIYAEHASAGTSEMAWRGAICAAALLPPTMLMGATLPAIARWLDTTQQGLARLGWFYGANLAGAVAGTLCAGFWLLRVYDVRVATWCAVGVNITVAGLAIAYALFAAPAPATTAATSSTAAPALVPRATSIYIAIALSGLTALGGEVIWTRLLSLLLGASVYTFSLILAVFLVGLGCGTAIGSRLARTSARPRLWFGVCQLVLPLGMVWTAFLIGHVIPYGEPTYVFQERVYQNMAIHYTWDFARCFVTLLPATLCWGASFPLALAAAGKGQPDPGRLVGGLYATNTIGAIVGALVTGLWAIAAVGTQHAQQGLALLAGLAALLLLFEQRGSPVLRVAAASALALAIAGVTSLLPRVPDGLIAFGRQIGDWDSPIEYLCVVEGTNASVAVTEFSSYTSFHVSGKVVASTEPLDMRLQRMLGHLPALVHGSPRKVLIVGCGAGVTAGCFADYPSVERIVVCEIEPKVVTAARAYLELANHNVLRDPRTEVVIDDARHFLATTRESFDIITSDPIHPWVRGAAALYSAEYHDLVCAHLAPGGIVSQWVPLYQTDEAAVKSQIGTFLHVFPHGTLWSSDLTGDGYDLVMMAQATPTSIDVDAMQNQIDENGMVRSSLGEVGFGTAVRLLSTYAGDGACLQEWLALAQRNVDTSLRLQYLAGLSLDVYRDKEIYRAIKLAFRMPTNLFRGEADTMDELERALVR